MGVNWARDTAGAAALMRASIANSTRDIGMRRIGVELWDPLANAYIGA